MPGVCYGDWEPLEYPLADGDAGFTIYSSVGSPPGTACQDQPWNSSNPSQGRDQHSSTWFCITARLGVLVLFGFALSKLQSSLLLVINYFGSFTEIIVHFIYSFVCFLLLAFYVFEQHDHLLICSIFISFLQNHRFYYPAISERIFRIISMFPSHRRLTCP